MLTILPDAENRLPPSPNTRRSCTASELPVGDLEGGRGEETEVKASWDGSLMFRRVGS